MRVVLDTNVFVATFVARGLCHELLEHCQRSHRVVCSTFILGELEAKLLGKFRVPPPRAAEVVELLRLHAEMVDPAALPHAVCRDPDDDWVLATARSGACDCIVTGDKDLLSLEDFEGMPILSPRGFWAFEAGRSGQG